MQKGQIYRNNTKLDYHQKTSFELDIASSFLMNMKFGFTNETFEALNELNETY